MRRLLTAVAFACVLPGAQAQLPNDVTGTMAMPQVRNRIYVADVAINHIVDGRMHIVDADTGRYLGLLGTGFAGQFTQSPDGSEIYVATTYLSRLTRGERVDVAEVWDARTLELKHEIPIDSKRAQALPYRGYLRVSSDGRLLYVMNATPAVSVSIVDLQAKKQVGELDIPGCWGIYPAARHARRFATLCGDGTMATFTLNDDGTPRADGGRDNSERFFDPDGDALFIHGEQDGDLYRFVSFRGTVVGIDAGDARARETERWSLLASPEDRAKRWRPGGYQPFAVDRKAGRLVVGMHPGGKEGSHKTPAAELWTFDLKTRKRLARLPGQAAIAVAVPASGDRMVYAIDGMKNALVVLGGAGMKVRHRLEPIGDASVGLESR